MPAWRATARRLTAFSSPWVLSTQEENARRAEATGLFRMKSPEQGAATSAFLAASPEVRGIGGRYFEDCHEAQVVERLDGLAGVLPHAVDPDAARELWEVSERLIAAARTGRAL